MSAAGLPVCLTRPPKLVLHPPPVSKSEIQSIPGISHSCRKTTKKQAKKGKRGCPSCPSCFLCAPGSGFLPSFDSGSLSGKTPEEVLKKYLQKVRHPPDEVRVGVPGGFSWDGLCPGMSFALG